MQNRICSLVTALDPFANPTLARILQTASLRDYEEGREFCIVRKEPGAVRRGIPVFAMADNVLRLGDSKSIEPGIYDRGINGVPGAILIDNVLSGAECDQLVKLTESAGYDPDAPTRLGREVRQNDNCVMIADKALNDAIFERCRSSLPAAVHGGVLCGINRRWRFYKYSPGDIFRAHIDPDGWTGSGFDNAGELLDDAYGDRTSRMTFLLYLNDDFTGGSTRFFMDAKRPRLGDAGECDRTVSVAPSQGSVLCFFHGRHDQSPWHEGEELRAGTKYVLRSDVLYKFADRRLPAFFR